MIVRRFAVRTGKNFSLAASIGALITAAAVVTGCSASADEDVSNNNSSTDGVTSEALSSGDVNGRLDEWYNDAGHYADVRSDVAKFYAPVTHNGCAAFMSSALRRIGVAVPMGSDSLAVTSFSAYLANQGWETIQPADLQPGDVVIAQGHVHTFMFHSWKVPGKLAYIIDNQGFRHLRNIGHSYGGVSYTPAAFGLRAPDQTHFHAPSDDVECTVDADCNAGESGTARVCGNAGICLDGCHSDDDCADGQSCNESADSTWTCGLTGQ